MKLTLDQTCHEYQLDGRVIPSVTKVISTVQLWRGMSAEDLEHARIRGSKVDHAVNLYDEGKLDIYKVDEEIVPYVLAWQRFKAVTGCTIIESQLSGFNQVYGYAGTLDKIVALPRPWGAQLIALIDIKATAKIEPEAALQTAAYENMDVVKQRWPSIKRFTLQLKPDGKHKLHEWKDRSDFPVWLAALTLKNWRAMHK